MDRNITPDGKGTTANVALLAEGVDRNVLHYNTLEGEYVALLAEGVDRNLDFADITGQEVVGRPPRGGRG